MFDTLRIQVFKTHVLLYVCCPQSSILGSTTGGGRRRWRRLRSIFALVFRRRRRHHSTPWAPHLTTDLPLTHHWPITSQLLVHHWFTIGSQAAHHPPTDEWGNCHTTFYIRAWHRKLKLRYLRNFLMATLKIYRVSAYYLSTDEWGNCYMSTFIL